MMYRFLDKFNTLVYPYSTRVYCRHHKHPKHMEDMGNPAGNSRLPDVLCIFAPHCNPYYGPCFLDQNRLNKPSGSTLVIYAKNFNVLLLDINNSIALILLYFGPTALIDGPRMHPVAMEDILNLALLGSEVPDAILTCKFPRSFLLDRRNLANPGIERDDLSCEFNIHPLKAAPSHLTESYF